MALQFPDAMMGMGFGIVRSQPQNADLQPQLPDTSGPAKGDLGMEPIIGLEPRPVAATPYKNLRKQ